MVILAKQYFGLNGMLTVMVFLGEIGLYDGIFRKLHFSSISRIKVLVDGMFGLSLDEKEITLNENSPSMHRGPPTLNDCPMYLLPNVCQATYKTFSTK